MKSFLRTQDSATLYGNMRTKYLKRPIYVSKPGVYLSADLGDFRNLSDHNEGVNYLLFILDVFSRKLEVYPIGDKKNSTVARQFEDFLKNGTSYNYRYLWVDEGTEFYGEPMATLAKRHNIKLYHVFNRRYKAALVERCIRTFKERLYRIIAHHNTKNYLPFVKSNVDSYNSSPHSGLLNLTPNFVHSITDREILMTLAKLCYKKNSNYSPRHLYKKMINGPPSFSSNPPLDVGSGHARETFAH